MYIAAEFTGLMSIHGWSLIGRLPLCPKIATKSSNYCSVAGVVVCMLISKNVIFEVLTAVTMENVVFWHIKTQFVLHRRHISAIELSELILRTI
jgi:hypothetical protein